MWGPHSHSSFQPFSLSLSSLLASSSLSQLFPTLSVLFFYVWRSKKNKNHTKLCETLTIFSLSSPTISRPPSASAPPNLKFSSDSVSSHCRKGFLQRSGKFLPIPHFSFTLDSITHPILCVCRRRMTKSPP